MSFRREKFLPKGGPDGGDGGRGGAIVFEATRRRNTLVDYRRNKTYRAENGVPGQGRQLYGRFGRDETLLVPIGTIIHDADTNEVLADLTDEGAQFVVKGGKGGKGNMRFKSATRRTPRMSTPGEEGTLLHVRLELKLIADVGLLGFPNAGKSTLISRVSRARPKVADYPFTTLVPNLGVVAVDDESTFVVADIPGLIEGAADGAGLGSQFLRHIERCAAYVHLVSPEDEDVSVAERYAAINAELARHDATLVDRPQVVVLSKCDLLDEERAAALQSELGEASGRPVHVISAVTGKGIQPLIYAMYEHVKARREALAGDTEA